MKKRDLEESLKHELVDVIVAAIGNYYNAGGTKDDLFYRMKRKSQKWLDRVNEENNE